MILLYGYIEYSGAKLKETMGGNWGQTKGNTMGVHWGQSEISGQLAEIRRRGTQCLRTE